MVKLVTSKSLLRNKIVFCLSPFSWRAHHKVASGAWCQRQGWNTELRLQSERCSLRTAAVNGSEVYLQSAIKDTTQGTRKTLVNHQSRWFVEVTGKIILNADEQPKAVCYCSIASFELFWLIQRIRTLRGYVESSAWWTVRLNFCSLHLSR